MAELHKYHVQVKQISGGDRTQRVEVVERSAALAEGRAEAWCKKYFGGGKWRAVFTTDRGITLEEGTRVRGFGYGQPG